MPLEMVHITCFSLKIPFDFFLTFIYLLSVMCSLWNGNSSVGVL